MELKMDDVTRLERMEYSNDSHMTPSYSKMLKFLDMHARHLESVTSKRKLLTITQWSRMTYPQFLFPQLPGGSICRTWSLLIPITEFQ